MSTEQGSRHCQAAEHDASTIRPGLIVEDSGCRDHAGRFRFTIPDDCSAAFLTTEEASDLARWLIWQASARAPRREDPLHGDRQP